MKENLFSAVCWLFYANNKKHSVLNEIIRWQHWTSFRRGVKREWTDPSWVQRWVQWLEGRGKEAVDRLRSAWIIQPCVIRSWTSGQKDNRDSSSSLTATEEHERQRLRGTVKTERLIHSFIHLFWKICSVLCLRTCILFTEKDLKCAILSVDFKLVSSHYDKRFYDHVIKPHDDVIWMSKLCKTLR